MALIAISARYGHGTYGLAEYGVVDISATLSGVEATGSVDDGFTFSNTTLLQSVVGAVAEPSVEPQVTEVISGVFATGAVNDNFTFSNSTVLTAVAANGEAGQTTETGVLFDFQAVREQYDRRRAVRIERAA